MKKIIILLLCLSLITACFIGCDSEDKTLDDKEFLSLENSDETTSEAIDENTSSETSSNTSEETSEETTAEILETVSDGTESTAISKAETDTTENTSEEESSTDITYYDALYHRFSSYEELEKALSGEDEDGKRELERLCYDVPELQIILDYIKQDDNLKKPLVNGTPIQVTSAGIFVIASTVEEHYLGPRVEYRSRTDDGFISVDIYYLCVEEFYNRDFSTFESPADISKAMWEDFDYNDWQEKTMQIGGESVLAIEAINLTDTQTRKIEYYNDGLYVSIRSNKKILTDEFLQSFSVGYVAPTDNIETPAEPQN